MDHIHTTDIMHRANALLRARESHLETKKVQEEAYSIVQQKERELVECMLEIQLQNFEMGNGIKISLREEFSLHVNKDNEFQVSQWLQETQGDVRQFTKESLHKPAIVALIRKLVEGGSLEKSAVPAFFGLNTYPSLQIRGLSSKE